MHTCISLLNDKEFWTSGLHSIMRYYNFYRHLVNSIKNTTGGMPIDIAVTKIGDMFYTDPCNSADNIAKNTQIYDVVRLKE